MYVNCACINFILFLLLQFPIIFRFPFSSLFLHFFSTFVFFFRGFVIALIIRFLCEKYEWNFDWHEMYSICCLQLRLFIQWIIIIIIYASISLRYQCPMPICIYISIFKYYCITKCDYVLEWVLENILNHSKT